MGKARILLAMARAPKTTVVEKRMMTSTTVESMNKMTRNRKWETGAYD